MNPVAESLRGWPHAEATSRPLNDVVPIAGMDHHLTKPVDIKTITELIARPG